MSSTAITLYGAEDTLQALIETAEGGIDEAQQEEFLSALQLADKNAVTKRDSVARFLIHAGEIQPENIDREIARLRALKASYLRVYESVSAYVVRTIINLGIDAKGKYKKLEGNTSILGVRKNRDSVDITDEAIVPAEFKVMTLKVPAAALEELLDNVDIDQRARFLEAVKKTECEVLKTPVAEAFAAGREVPGAKLVSDKYSLSLK